jgi:hypothetical protein
MVSPTALPNITAAIQLKALQIWRELLPRPVLILLQHPLTELIPTGNPVVVAWRPHLKSER